MIYLYKIERFTCLTKRGFGVETCTPAYGRARYERAELVLGRELAFAVLHT